MIFAFAEHDLLIGVGLPAILIHAEKRIHVTSRPTHKQLLEVVLNRAMKCCTHDQARRVPKAMPVGMLSSFLAQLKNLGATHVVIDNTFGHGAHCRKIDEVMKDVDG